MAKKSRVKNRHIVAMEVASKKAAEKPSITQADMRTPLDELRLNVRRQNILQRRIGQQVLELRGAGYSWQLIGDQLNMTRQGARQRYGGDLG